jgi:D-xylose transport system substrate-binding protein
MRKSFIVLIALLIVGLLAMPVVADQGGAKAKFKIGLSFSDFATERWPNEAALLTKLAFADNIQVVSQVANHDTKLQNDQIENMVLQGVDVLIIVAEDGAACAQAVDNAKKNNPKIKVIAYDRLIPTANIDAYISFDNVEVGRAQARGVTAVVNKGNFVKLGGSPTDNNAKLFRKGQDEIIDPLVAKGQIKIVADQWIENWEPSNAVKVMENILTAQKNKVDAVVASNDGTALGALQALKAQGLAGKVPISGQDATSAGCKSIVEGELTMTVMKDIRKLAPLAIDLAKSLYAGDSKGLKPFKLSELTLNAKLAGNVNCLFLDVIQVDAKNVYDVVIKSGFQKYDEVYKDIPAAKRPAKP